MMPIDTQGPLIRRKALIQRLMAQMQGQPDPGGRTSLRGRAAPGLARGAAVQSMTGGTTLRPGNLEPRGRAIASLKAPPWAAVNQGVPQAINESVPQAPPPVEPPPVDPPPTAPIGPDPTPIDPYTVPSLPTWVQQKFLSQEAMNAFNAMSPEEQARVMANPVYRRRYYAS